MGDRIAALRCFRQAEEALKNTANLQGPQLGYQLYQSSVISDPEFVQGWEMVGHSDFNLGATFGAVGCYRRALELPDGLGEGDMNPERRAKTLVSMAHALQTQGRIDDALEALHEAMAIDDGLSLGWLNLSLCYATQGQLTEAVVAAKKAYALDPKNPAVEMALAFALLFSGSYAKGLKHHEARFPYKLQSFLSYPFPKWDGAAGKSVFLVADQGIGDTLSFSRFVEQAAKRAKFLHMAVQPELVRLFAAAFQHIPNKNIIPLPCPWPPAEAWSTFMSLPVSLGLTDDEIAGAPNIHIPKFRAPSLDWKSPDRKIHIGVCWSGSAANDINRWRSFPLEHLLELYTVPGIQLYSLQVGEDSKKLHEAGSATLLRDLSGYIRDVSDSVGLLEHLDLVIGCESALGHICAAINKPFVMPYSYHGRDFRVGYDGSRRLWTPHHVVFKQGKDARWEPVFARIADYLRERLSIVEQMEAAE